MSVINFSTRRVGGLRFIKIGRFTFMYCLSKQYKPLHNAVKSAAHSGE